MALIRYFTKVLFKIIMFSSWQTNMLNEKNALAAQVKKLQRDVAKVRNLLPLMISALEMLYFMLVVPVLY